MCGAHGEWRFMNLHKSCSGLPVAPTAFYRLRQLLAHKHPRTGNPLSFSRQEGSRKVKASELVPVAQETAQSTAPPAAIVASASVRMAALKERIRRKEADKAAEGC